MKNNPNEDHSKIVYINFAANLFSKRTQVRNFYKLNATVVLGLL